MTEANRGSNKDKKKKKDTGVTVSPVAAKLVTPKSVIDENVARAKGVFSSAALAGQAPQGIGPKNTASFLGSKLNDFTKPGGYVENAYRSPTVSRPAPAPTGVGGGGGGSSAPSYAQLTADRINEMLTSGSYNDPYAARRSALESLYGTQQQSARGLNEDLMASLNRLAGQASGDIGGAYDNLDAYLSALSNPFENTQVNSSVADPDMAALLQAQGVDPSSLNSMVSDARSQAALQGGTFGALNDVLANLVRQDQSGRRTDSKMGRTSALQSLAANRQAYGSQAAQQLQAQLDAIAGGLMKDQNAVDEQSQGRRTELEDLLLQLSFAGTNPKKPAAPAAPTGNQFSPEALAMMMARSGY
jgi:hypothetical protein